MRPKEFVADEHEIDPSQIDADALFVIQKLNEEGFKAYLVGGSVRDLLCKRIPKDYDISTSARPQEIKRIFRRNCFLIGKRFRLAHIRFGHKVIEVSTFRSGDNDSDLIIRDNTWGSEEEDVLRRDFTINGLFYDPFHHKVIDYVGGWEDIHKKVLRTIGDPLIRFKQDPVRMIRLLKFRARFGFEIAPETKQALLESREEIMKSSPARVLEEMLRMLESGAGAPFLYLMIQAKMLKLIFPALNAFLESPEGGKIYNLLNIADQLNKQDLKHPLDRSVLTSCLLYPILEKEIHNRFIAQEQTPNLGDVMTSAHALITASVTASFTHFPRRISSTMALIMAMQYRLTPPSGKRSYRPKILGMKEFTLALQFLKMRAVVDRRLVESYNSWNNAWRQFQKKGVHKKHSYTPFQQEAPHDVQEEQPADY